MLNMNILVIELSKDYLIKKPTYPYEIFKKKENEPI